MGPFTAHTPIPNQSSPMIDYFYPITWLPEQPQLQPQLQPVRPIITNNLTTTSIMPITPKIDEKYTHSRSKSVGTANNEFIHNPYQNIEEHISTSSLSIQELNTGKALLLTQKFVYQSPSIRNQELSSSNPFNISSNTTTITTSTTTSLEDDGEEKEEEEENICSPFDDKNSQEEINLKPNTYSIPPPPVPNQLTKPAFPKYTRTNTFLIKRSQSTVADRKPITTIIRTHQRHKSTNDVFY